MCFFFFPVTPSVLRVLHRLPADEKTHIFNIPILWDTEQMVRNHLSMGKWKLCLPKDCKPPLCCKHLAMPLRKKVSENSWCLCFKGNVSRAKFSFFFSPPQKTGIFLRAESSKSPLKKTKCNYNLCNYAKLGKTKFHFAVKRQGGNKRQTTNNNKRKERGHTRRWPVPAYNRNTPGFIGQVPLQTRTVLLNDEG